MDFSNALMNICIFRGGGKMSITLKELKIAAARPSAKAELNQIFQANNGCGLFHEFMEEI